MVSMPMLSQLSTTPTLTGLECQGLGSPPPVMGVMERRSAVLSPMVMAILLSMDMHLMYMPMVLVLQDIQEEPPPMLLGQAQGLESVVLMLSPMACMAMATTPCLPTLSEV